MTQASRPQADSLSNYPAPSDPGPYSGDQWAELFQILFTGDQQATQGPFVRYLNELEVTDNGSTAVYVDTGAGMVNGHALISSEQETWAIPAGPAGGRTDRVVMVENNTNVEVTQSTAARPLLFPNDLSEYTATPGVPAYSARLAILRGDDLGALPALDQTNNLYMVELARYDINNVPTISAATDYREFCCFSSTVGTRSVFAPCVGGERGGAISVADTRGLEMTQGADTEGYGFFQVPTDFKANMVITPVVTPGGTGNINTSTPLGTEGIWYGECSQIWSTHQDAVTGAVVAVTFDTHECIVPTTLTTPTIGDILHLYFRRSGSIPSDTLAASIYLAGWLVTYEAKS